MWLSDNNTNNSININLHINIVEIKHINYFFMY